LQGSSRGLIEILSQHFLERLSEITERLAWRGDDLAQTRNNDTSSVTSAHNIYTKLLGDKMSDCMLFEN